MLDPQHAENMQRMLRSLDLHRYNPVPPAPGSSQPVQAEADHFDELAYGATLALV